MATAAPSPASFSPPSPDSAPTTCEKPDPSQEASLTTATGTDITVSEFLRLPNMKMKSVARMMGKAMHQIQKSARRAFVRIVTLMVVNMMSSRP